MELPVTTTIRKMTCWADRDLEYKLANNLRTRLNAAIRNGAKSGSAIRDLGCTIEELIVHLEKLFLPGMTWSNWALKGWHIDHIKPLASFNLMDKEQFLQACHYTNLQSLWVEEHKNKTKKDIKNLSVLRS